jgi:hypothetical protein
MIRGWKNLTPERFKTRGRENAALAIRQIHPDAYETQIGDDYAYWLGKENPHLVGVAWKVSKSEISWWFAYMGPSAVEAGLACSLIRSDTDNRIIPAMPRLAAKECSKRPGTICETPLVCGSDCKFDNDPIHPNRIPPKVRRTRVVEPMTREVYRKHRGWFAWVETSKMARELGPFTTRDEAEIARP